MNNAAYKLDSPASFHGAKGILKKIFAGKSLFAMLVASLVVLLPFIFWAVSVPFFQSMHNSGLPFFQLAYFEKWVVVGLASTIVANVAVGFPALFFLYKNAKKTLKNYVLETAKWVLVVAVVFVACNAEDLHGIAGFVLAAVITYISFYVPASLAAMVYWYFIVRENENRKPLMFVALGFFVWNVLSVLLFVFANM